jgi:uncharacterized protein (DUF2132 family)
MHLFCAGVQAPEVREQRQMASSRKKVIVRTDAGGEQTVQAGYLPVAGFLNRANGQVELLDTAGRIVPIALKAVRYVAYVRDFNLEDRENPERLLRKTFLARPRTEGLWVRATFRDGEVIEGLAALDLALLEDAATDEGVFLIPPDVRSNTRRLYIPRSSLSALQLIGVITTPSKAAATPGKKKHADELDLPFPELR